MLIKICWKKDFIEQEHDSQSKQSERRSARRTALLVEQGCKYSPIPMTVNQELLSNTKHAYKSRGVQSR